MNEDAKCIQIGQMEGSFESVNRVYSVDGISPTQTTYHTDAETKILIKQATKEGYTEIEEGGIFDASFPNSNTRRGRVQNKGQCSPTLTAQNQEIYRIESQYRIRKLTPLECFRLMGVEDTDSKKMLGINSNSQCYKQAGNSIVVDVMAAMFQKLF